MSCTSQCNLDTVNVSDIKFVKMEYGKQKRLSSVAPYDPRPLSLQHTSVEEVQFLRNALQLKGDAALLHVIPNTAAVSSHNHTNQSSASTRA